MSRSLDLSGTRCLITGATGALGSATARALYERGADLVLTARSAESLAALAGELRDHRIGDVTLVPLDLALASSVAKLVDRLDGGLDVLINNAAVQGPIGPFATTDWDAWEAALRFDLLVPVALTRAVLGLLTSPGHRRTRRSKVIMVSGGGATGPRPNFSAYAVAKTGLVRFAECLAHELKDSPVDVNAVAPGAMPSALTAMILAADPAATGAQERASAEKALGSGGAETLVRAAELIAYLASAVSDGITGRLISAVWDPWPRLATYRDSLAPSDIFTLRRIVPGDRGQSWDE